MRLPRLKPFKWLAGNYPRLPHLKALPVIGCLMISPSYAAPAEKYASIIIDDLGNNIERGAAIANLPGALTLAILPRTAYSRDIARLGKKNNKEIMLHLPLQSVVNRKASPGTLELHMTQEDFTRQLRRDLGAVPYIRGVNNHMGSLLTRHPGHMSWLMQELSTRRNLYFVDSKTTPLSIADRIADEYHVPNLSRHFFLDPDEKKATIEHEFKRFLARINHSGYALAIAHPYPNTIKFLQEHLAELQKQNIKLVPVSELITVRNRLLARQRPHEREIGKQKPSDPNRKGEKHVTCTGTTCSGL